MPKWESVLGIDIDLFLFFIDCFDICFVSLANAPFNSTANN